MRYLLDTCVISDFIKGEPGTQTRIKQTPLRIPFFGESMPGFAGFHLG
jgi:predicted nucleic acid-binding protein